MQKLEKTELVDMIDYFRSIKESIIFFEPVKEEEHPTYKNIIKRPMDLLTLSRNITDDYYKTIDEALLDFGRIWFNCKLFNSMGSYLYNLASDFELIFIEEVDKRFNIKLDKQNMRYLYIKENSENDNTNLASLSNDNVKQVILNKIKYIHPNDMDNLLRFIIKLEPNVIQSFTYDEIKLGFETLSFNQMVKLNEHLDSLPERSKQL